MSIESGPTSTGANLFSSVYGVRGGCIHEPQCPDSAGADRDAAHVVASHPEQGWSLLCNGVVLFEDSGEILPDGACVQARRADLTAAALHRVA
ncbi:MAG: hypothetical protein QOK10_2087 [Pseudonocardiales bacterium]|jgi:hypothetical protein|nr:hypothetical protein [Pseudonocardiales bacterium]